MQLLEKEALVQRTKAKMTDRELTQSQASTLTGLSPTNLSFILSKDEKWRTKSIHDTQWQKLAAWLQLDSNGEQWQTVETRNYLRVHKICQDAMTKGNMITISASQGVGKSHALKAFHDLNPRNVFYIECRDFWSKKDFLHNLKKVFGLEIYPQSISDNMEDIKAFLLGRKEKPLVIIDEADKLKEGVFGFLKDFYDLTYRRCGWVICGGNHLRKRLEKGVRLCKMSYQELFSRMGGEFLSMHPIDPETIFHICQANGISSKEDIKEVINTAENDLRRVERRIQKIKYLQAATR